MAVGARGDRRRSDGGRHGLEVDGRRKERASEANAEALSAEDLIQTLLAVSEEVAAEQ